MRDHAPPRDLLPVLVLAHAPARHSGSPVTLSCPTCNWSGGLPSGAVSGMTSAVQLGFIAGTLGFALMTIAECFSAPRVFFVSSLVGAAANAATTLLSGQLGLLLLRRFAVGVALAGVYLVGMKLAASWYRSEGGSPLMTDSVAPSASR